MKSLKYRYAIIILIFLLLMGFLISLHIGAIDVPFSAVINNFNPVKLNVDAETAESFKAIIAQIRLPRILAVVVCGIALSISGAAYQSMFMNPLVSPDLLGVLSGAAFGASLAMLIGSEIYFVQLLAFIFGFLSVGFSILLSRLFVGNRLIMLIMGGITSASLFTALISVIKYAADANNKLPAIVYWLMGGFSGVSAGMVYGVLLVMAVASVLIMLLSGYLNVLSMGDEEALALGVNVSKIRIFMIALTTLVCSLTVSIGGIVGWVGLMIPHIARMLFGHDNRRLLPASALIGGLYLLVVDDICRSCFASEMPIGILTSLLGVPFFIFVLYKTGQRWN